MHLLVTFKALDTCDSSLGAPPRHGTLDSMLQEALGPDGVVASGSYADLPGSFFMVDVGSTEELAEILGWDLLDNCHIEISRVTVLEKVAAHFEHWYSTQQPSPASRDV